jgi:hypothetical protein
VAEPPDVAQLLGFEEMNGLELFRSSVSDFMAPLARCFLEELGYIGPE